MGFIKAGFIGGFLGIVISIANIFVNSKILEKLSSVGLYVANFFGKACINTEEIQCTLAQKFTTIMAVIVGNTIAYFIIFALISMGFSIIKMWFTSKPKAPEASQSVQSPQVQEQQVPQQTLQQPVQLQQPLPVQPQQQVPQQSTQQVQIEQPQIMQVQIEQPEQTQEKQKIRKISKKKAKITKKYKNK